MKRSVDGVEVEVYTADGHIIEQYTPVQFRFDGKQTFAVIDSEALWLNEDDGRWYVTCHSANKEVGLTSFALEVDKDSRYDHLFIPGADLATALCTTCDVCRASADQCPLRSGGEH